MAWAVVYRAYDTRRHRIVAIKRMPRHLAMDQEFRTRFQRESALAAKLREPHVVPIHDYGEIDGQLYIDMRLVEGIDLGSVLKKAPVTLARAVDIVSQIADALDAAHDDGLVHRDVKPSNVLLVGKPAQVADRGFAYLADFGIAANLGGSDAQQAGTRARHGVLHGARADGRRAVGPPRRRLRAGVRAVRGGGRSPPVPGRGPAGRAARPPPGAPTAPVGAGRGAAGRARRGHRARHGEEVRRPLRQLRGVRRGRAGAAGGTHTGPGAAGVGGPGAPHRDVAGPTGRRERDGCFCPVGAPRPGCRSRRPSGPVPAGHRRSLAPPPHRSPARVPPARDRSARGRPVRRPQARPLRRPRRSRPGRACCRRPRRPPIRARPAPPGGSPVRGRIRRPSCGPDRR